MENGDEYTEESTRGEAERMLYDRGRNILGRAGVWVGF